MFKSKLGNKGFAVSSVLYTLLVAFLLFLGAALAEFSTSAKLLSKANEDMTDGLEYDINAVYYEDGSRTSPVTINNLSEFPYKPSDPSKSGHTFNEFLSYDNGGNANTADSGTLYCTSNNSYENYSFPIKYGNIKNFAKSKKCTGDIEIRYTANFIRDAVPTLVSGTRTDVFKNSAISKSNIVTIEFRDTIDKSFLGYKWDASENNDGSVMAYYTDSGESGLYNLVIEADGIIQFPESSEDLFADYNMLRTIKFGDAIDTSNVKNMTNMFSYCSSLISLEGINKFDTSSVETMDVMFAKCSSLEELTINFDTRNVKSMYGMFFDDQKLKKLDISSFQIPNLSQMTAMFYQCFALEKLDIRNFNFDNGPTHELMLYGVPDGANIYVKDQKAYDFINSSRSNKCTATTCKKCSEVACP